MTRILFVDDDMGYRGALARLLEFRGFHVQVAGHPDEAIATATAPDQPRFDLAIIDWMLGDGLDGVELLINLRARDPRLPAIIISGYPSIELRERLRKLEHCTFLGKPFSFERLNESIDDHLRDHDGSQDGSDTDH